MKRFFTTISLLILLFTTVFSQAVGQLTFSVQTSNAGGGYAPKNIVAVWIETNSGTFVKTLYAYTGQWKTHLNTWQASSNYNTTDAITGATYSSHTTRNYTWDGQNTSGAAVADGTYKLRIELTDKNGTGNYTTYSFVKSTAPQTITPANVSSFSNVTIIWTPDLSDIAPESSEELFDVFPNPTSGVININGKNIKSVEILNITGQLIVKGKMTSADISAQPNGLYFIKVTDENGSYTRKIMKQ